MLDFVSQIFNFSVGLFGAILHIFRPETDKEVISDWLDDCSWKCGAVIIGDRWALTTGTFQMTNTKKLEISDFFKYNYDSMFTSLIWVITAGKFRKSNKKEKISLNISPDVYIFQLTASARTRLPPTTTA